MIILLLVVLSVAGVISASPVDSVTEDTKHTELLSSATAPASLSTKAPTTSVTPSIPCQKFVDDQNIAQFAFPVCHNHGGESLTNAIVHGMPCTCNLNNHEVKKRSDYTYVPGFGAYKLHPKGTTFNNARKICNEESGHLAIINSLAEEQVLLDIFSRVPDFKNVSNSEEAFIGIHDLFAEDEWVTIQGDSIRIFGYSKWSKRWGGQPDNGGGIQHCGALMREGGMDDVNCNAHFAFFCEIPEVRVPRF